MTFRRLAALGLVLGAGFACSGGSGVETFDTAAILRQAGPAPWTGTGVLRARWGGGRIVEWLDRRTGATRSVDRGGFGSYIVVQDGHRVVRWSEPAGTASLAEVIDPHDPWLDGTSEILSYWHKLNRGAAQIVGEDDVDGRRVWVVEVERGTGGDAPRDLKIVAELDRSTFLPLRVRTESEEDEEYAGTRTVAYTEAENADRRALFSVDRRLTSRETRLRYSDLGFLPFPVYAPPRRVGDLRYSPASTHQEADGRSTFFLSYVRSGDPFSKPAITLAETEASAERRFPPRGDLVRIAGGLRRVHVTEDGQIWVTIGETLIHGRTTLSRNETMRFLRALRAR